MFLRPEAWGAGIMDLTALWTVEEMTAPSSIDSSFNSFEGIRKSIIAMNGMEGHPLSKFYKSWYSELRTDQGMIND
jgi:hypothetical protein